MGDHDLRLVDLLAALSVATDLGMGQEPEKAVRGCLVATGLARAMDLPDRDVADIFYTTLLHHVGCTARLTRPPSPWGTARPFCPWPSGPTAPAGASAWPCWPRWAGAPAPTGSATWPGRSPPASGGTGPWPGRSARSAP